MQRLIYLIVIALGLTGILSAQTSRLVHYQGRLAGTNVSSTPELSFRLYPDSLETWLVWEETHENVTIQNGVFNVILGGINAFPDSAFFGGRERWLQVRVDGVPMQPIQQLLSIPYAINAQTAHSLSASDGNPTHAVVVDANGYVGIGTTAPIGPLEVEGKIYADSIHVGDGYFQTYTINYTGTLEANEWTTVFSGSVLPTGTYVMNAWLDTHTGGGATWRETHSGLLSWYLGDTNANDEAEEISTHSAGHAPNNETVNFQVIRRLNQLPLEFQIKSSHGWNGGQTVVLRFRRLL